MLLDDNAQELGRLTLDLADDNGLSLGDDRAGSLGGCSAVESRVAVTNLLLLADRRVELLGSSGLLGNFDQIDAGGVLVLRVARIELDDGLDLIEGGDVDGERGLGDEEGEAFGAGWGGERSGVLEELGGGLEVGLDVGEVERGDLGLGAGLGDGSEVGLETGD